MLSRAEIEFLRNPSNFDANYSKSLRCRLNKKVKTLRQEMQLLEEAGFVVANNRNWVTKNSCGGNGANRSSPQNPSAFMVRSPGFEPGSSAWEADVLAKLDYDRSYEANG
jgi:hypothetical protein